MEASIRHPGVIRLGFRTTHEACQPHGTVTAVEQGAAKAQGVQGPQPSYNISLDQPAPGTVKIRSGEAPMRPGLPLAIGPTNIMVQSRLRAPNTTTPADAFSRFGPEKQRMQADGSCPPGERLLTSQRRPKHYSLFSQGTPSHYSSSTKGPHHSSSSVKKKHPPFPTSANLGELATKRARATLNCSLEELRSRE